MEHTDRIRLSHTVVVKVGTSTLCYPNGHLNFQRIDSLAAVLSKLQKSGKRMVLVSSGAIAAGSGKLGINDKPTELAEKQALAAIGQAGLMKIYQKFFDMRQQQVAQVLLTKDIVVVPERRQNASNTLHTLVDMDIIPIINENDTLATDEIEFGDNDTLSAYVASLVDADLLVMLSDIEGLYAADPRIDSTAQIIPLVTEITPELEKAANGSGSSFGTGGMVTKLAAARVCREAGIPVVIASGRKPAILHEILAGKQLGTVFWWG
jgi:glutamate 5-kinase